MNSCVYLAVSVSLGRIVSICLSQVYLQPSLTGENIQEACEGLGEIKRGRREEREGRGGRDRERKGVCSTSTLLLHTRLNPMRILSSAHKVFQDSRSAIASPKPPLHSQLQTQRSPLKHSLKTQKRFPLKHRRLLLAKAPEAQPVTVSHCRSA